MPLKRFVYIPIIFLLVFGLLACGGGGSKKNNLNDKLNPDSTGKLSVNITDAAVDSVERVYVQFASITVKPTNGEPKTLPLSGGTQTCLNLLEQIPPQQPPEGENAVRCLELKELQGTTTANLLNKITLSSGKYSWIRLNINAEENTMDSIIKTNNGGLESLYIPSNSQSGLTINSEYTILPNKDHTLVIDFDLRKSLHDPQGLLPDYRLTPTLRMANLANSGHITGTIDTPYLTSESCTGDVNSGSGFAVYIYNHTEGVRTIIGEEGSANAPLTSASVILYQGLWEYTVGYLTPGYYTVAFTCQALGDSAENPNDNILFVETFNSPTTVVANQTSIVNFTP